jgi:Fe2+ or Zn2+ uptake regulation protein
MSEQRLKISGYKNTNPRKAVLDFVVNSKTPVSAKIIHKKNPGIDLVSVYRNLKFFKKLGLVFEDTLKNETFYYASEKMHHHIMCSSCGKIECVPCDHKLPKIKNFTNIAHKLLLSGICGKCKK